MKVKKMGGEGRRGIEGEVLRKESKWRGKERGISGAQRRHSVGNGGKDG